MAQLLTRCNQFLWGAPMIALFLLCGLVCTVRCGFLQFRHLPHCLKATLLSPFEKKRERRAPGEFSPFQSLCTSLGATIGTGNIIGVTTALVLGGPGSLVWMWLAALLGMASKYAEILLGLHFRRKGPDGRWQGGPMVYLRRLPLGRALGGGYLMFCLLSSLAMGDMAQSHAVSFSLRSMLPLSPLPVALTLGGGMAIIIWGGSRRVARITTVMTPVMALGYLAGCAALLYGSRQYLPQAVAEIFSDFLSPGAVGGGLAGQGIGRAMRYGFARGLFSNEAGLGTAAVAHSGVHCQSAVGHSLWGVCEVLIDTFVICTMTALVVLTSPAWRTGVFRDGTALIFRVFVDGFGPAGRYVFSLALLLFSLSTLIAWSYYGGCCAHQLGGAAMESIYRGAFVVFCSLGALWGGESIWQLCDFFNACMALPNLVGLMALSGVVSRLTRQYFKAQTSNRP